MKLIKAHVKSSGIAGKLLYEGRKRSKASTERVQLRKMCLI
jgi:hypothetical protein